MELYCYYCPDCGFVHQVPAYWVSFAPEPTMEYPHIRLDNRETCETLELLLQKEE